MNTKIILNGRDIGEYTICISSKISLCENHAATELQRYVSEATGISLPVATSKVAGPTITVVAGERAESYPLYGEIKYDGFAYCVQGEDIAIYAKELRGVLYGVYDLLEKMGWRFLTAESRQRGIEWHDYMLPVEIFKNKGKTVEVTLSDKVDNPWFYYRDGLSFATLNEDWATKNRYNAQTWNIRNLSGRYGGGVGFSGQSGHTFGVLVPRAKYGKSNPEFYAEIDGVRQSEDRPDIPAPEGDWGAQLCMTNEDVIPVIVEKLCEWVKKTNDPTKKIVSVSQNDNRKFCQCEKCRAAYEKYGGIGGVLCRFVNKVAEEFEKHYPEYLVHTFIYWDTANTAIDNGVYRHNVMPQYCIRQCMSHDVDDENCVINVRAKEKLRKLGTLTENLFIYGYLSPLSCDLATLPNLDYFNHFMRNLAENNARGIYSEMAMFNYQTPGVEELRAYLYGKLMWNPFMSDEEYFAIMDDFLECYYGAGWKYVREYIDYWCKTCKYYHVEFHGPRSCDDQCRLIRDEDGSIPKFRLFPRAMTEEVCEKCLALLDKAKELADYRQAHRVEILKVSPLWYELYVLLREKYAEGGETKKVWKKKYEKLLRSMRVYAMKPTAWSGMRNLQKMYDCDYEFLPDEWEYPGAAGSDNIFNLGDKAAD